ncbi:hypothetical protein [Lacibacter cauensis]|uniref:hypothetical protein n=1 Tax=Lacibacter cauensis TaxID=510947 RepID=UPI0011A32734|nr:hypothetical protein [Lacibacter cauensis]
MLLLLYLLFINGIVHQTGIITINEAEKYISAAKSLYKGNFTDAFSGLQFYTSYILFLSVFYLPGNVVIVVAAQALLSFTASIYLRSIVELLTKDKFVSIIGQCLFLFAFPIQSWTTTLFSDSFFISVSTITLYYTLKEKTKKDTILWFMFNLVLVFARPPGIFFVLPSIIFYLHQTRWLTAKSAIVLFLVSFTLIIFCIFHLPAETKGYIRPIAAGRVIVDSNDYTLPDFTTNNKSTLADAYSYLYNKKDIPFLINLYTKKVLSFFKLTRPYYSKTHNFLLHSFYFLYLFAFTGLISCWNKGNKSVSILAITILLGIINIVALTYNEWHYRFTVTIFPILIVFSMISIAIIRKRFA